MQALPATGQFGNFPHRAGTRFEPVWRSYQWLFAGTQETEIGYKNRNLDKSYDRP